MPASPEADDFVDVTVERSRRLDQCRADAGRDPATARRSLLVYPRFVDAWVDEAAAEALVEKFRQVGFTEFAFYWPSPAHRRTPHGQSLTRRARPGGPADTERRHRTTVEPR